MENSERFFANRNCRYYPCHPGIEEMNCLFCYCPLYTCACCPGKPAYIQTKEGKTIKDCSGCTFPHEAENYDKMICCIAKRNQGELKVDLVL